MPIELPDDVKVRKVPTRRGKSVGRPRKYQTPKDLSQAIEDYFAWLDDYNETMDSLGKARIKPGKAELCHSLGFGSRTALYEYSKKSEQFKHVIDAAMLRIEAIYVRDVIANSNYAHGWLKKNAPDEWGEDKPDEETTVNTGSVTVTVTKKYGRDEDDGQGSDEI